ncbi:PQQ-dependent sugar dehydrogenase [Salipaludibacillus daqingensis]|uniref:PQQ-dependent sugar dehydrogenase n=1 Tax=Salipaludibacillus daqingensis TaxID=3041001 RepID=UPI0024764F83|nr:PQQ-dependent sugar dehydrogenase [Salipaludibacillus daqingensis]
MNEQTYRLSFIIIGMILIFAACQSVENDEVLNEENNQTEQNEVTENQANNLENQEPQDEQDNKLGDMKTEDWEVETVAENLDIPWSLNIYEKIIYMTDRDGHILEVNDGETEQTTLETSSPIAHQGEGGLLGFVLAEDFGTSNEGFAYYTFESEEGSLANRVVKVEKDDGWAETEILLDDIPGAGIHNGGRLAIGPDDNLYVTTGDADIPSDAQDDSNLAGSILRMTMEGEIPDDNPTEDSYVYSYGHRNPQGLAWNEEGELYSSEHGPVAQDEINLIQPGNNYGWPVIEGDQTNDGMEEPLIHSGDDTWAPSGIAFWDNQLLVAGLRGESLYYFDEEQNDMVEVFQGEGRLRDVAVVDEAIYLITNNTDGRGTPKENDDRLLKLTMRN